jgi:uracil-DNA glycosylase family 4
MGFAAQRASLIYRGSKERVQTLKGGVSLKLLHEAQCHVCPLNSQRGVRTPHMAAHGADYPIIYMLGEAPGKDEDAEGIPFVGAAGRTLRRYIPKDWNDKDLRWNNVVRTRPPDNRTPEPIEIECCRPSIVKDIEFAQPQAIFGFGNIPLGWAMPGQSGITKWSHKRVPVRIGSHVCWYFPIIHPSAVNRSGDAGSSKREIEEFAFAVNVKWAFEEVKRGLPDPIVHTRDDALANLVTIDGSNKGDFDLVLDWIESLYDEDVIGFDYETDRLRPYDDDSTILTIATATVKQSVAFALDHEGTQWTKDERRQIVRAWMRFLREAKTRKAVHNAAFEIEWTAVHFGTDAVFGSGWECTQGQAYMLDERSKAFSGNNNEREDARSSLQAVCWHYFGLDIKSIDNTDRKNLAGTPIDKVLRYNALDAKYHLLSYFAQMDELQEQDLVPVYQEHMRRVRTATLTQVKGVPVNQKVVDKFVEKYENHLADVSRDLEALPVIKEFKRRTGRSYRPGATEDVITVVYDMLGYSKDDAKKAKGRKGKQGKTDKKGLADETALKNVDHPVGALTIEWRKVAKQLSTYVLPNVEGEKDSNVFSDGLLHPQLNTDVTKTWRSSSSGPNIQNWTKRDPETKEVRGQIKPRPGYKVWSFDYSGIQARNVAMESKDKALVDAFWHDYDIHSDWMERIVRVHPRWVDGKRLANDKDYRKAARHRSKNELVFPFFFGAGARSVAAALGIPENCGQELREEFLSDFSGIKNWHADLHAHFKKHGWITGLSGHRRRAPVAPNELINAPIQADESIIVFDAMTRLSEIDDEFQATLMVHDDLTFIWETERGERNAEIVIKEMLNCPYKWAHIVPIGVEASVGDDWCNLERVGEYSSDKWNGGLRKRESNKREDSSEAVRERDKGIARVLSNNSEWKDAAMRSIRELPRGYEGTGEQIRLDVLDAGLDEPNHHNAWGAIIRSALVSGVLEGTGEFRKMETTKSHARKTEVLRRT